MNKKRLLVVTALVFAGAAHADSAYYYSGPLPYNNDPFKFCSIGMPQHGWIAVLPASGTWAPISKYVNYKWIPTYEEVCPHSHGVPQYEAG